MEMIDFVTCELVCRLPRIIRAGTVVKIAEGGEVEWETSTRLTVKGSWDSSVQVRAISTDCLEISGNLAKFLQGHNIFGTSNMRDLLRAFLDRVQPILWPEGMPYIEIESGKLSRVDCTSGFLCDTLGDVLTWIRAAEQRGTVSHRGKGVLKGEGTLVYGDATGKRAKDWQVTFYSKGLEVAKRPLPLPMLQRNDVLAFVNRLLRCEVRLRTAELKRMGLRTVEDWQEGSCAAAWREKVERVKFAEGDVMAYAEIEGQKPRLVAAYYAWESGCDLRAGRSRTNWYKLRAEMRDAFGVDIASPQPKSNVVPLRRLIVATPVQRPPWADEVAALLAA